MWVLIPWPYSCLSGLLFHSTPAPSSFPHRHHKFCTKSMSNLVTILLRTFLVHLTAWGRKSRIIEVAFQPSDGNLGNHIALNWVLLTPQDACPVSSQRFTPYAVRFHPRHLFLPSDTTGLVVCPTSVLLQHAVLSSCRLCHCTVVACSCDGAMNSLRAGDQVLIFCFLKPDTETDTYRSRYHLQCVCSLAWVMELPFQVVSSHH